MFAYGVLYVGLLVAQDVDQGLEANLQEGHQQTRKLDQKRIQVGHLQTREQDQTRIQVAHQLNREQYQKNISWEGIRKLKNKIKNVSR